MTLLILLSTKEQLVTREGLRVATGAIHLPASITQAASLVIRLDGLDHDKGPVDAVDANPLVTQSPQSMSKQSSQSTQSTVHSKL